LSTATDATGLCSGQYQKQRELRHVAAAHYCPSFLSFPVLDPLQRLAAENASRERAGKWAAVPGEIAPAAAAVPYQEGARMQVRCRATGVIYFFSRVITAIGNGVCLSIR
jgi:hypothetical protein